MQIIIFGAKNAELIIKHLVSFADVILIDDNKSDVLKILQYDFDIKIIENHYFSNEVTQDFLLQNSDILIANTTDDNLNMLLCRMMKQLIKPKKSIAVINNRHNLKPEFIKDIMDIDHIIFPPEEIISQIVDEIVSFKFNKIFDLSENLHIYSINIDNEILKKINNFTIDILALVREKKLIYKIKKSDIQEKDILICIIEAEEISKIQDTTSEKITDESLFIFGSTQICDDLIQHAQRFYKKINVISDQTLFLEELCSKHQKDINYFYYKKYDQSVLELFDNYNETINIALLKDKDIENIFLYFLLQEIKTKNAILQVKDKLYSSHQSSLGDYIVINPYANYAQKIEDIVLNYIDNNLVIHSFDSTMNSIVTINIKDTKNIKKLSKLIKKDEIKIFKIIDLQKIKNVANIENLKIGDTVILVLTKSLLKKLIVNIN
ncbi:TrkA family potassium uptake protein [Anaplasmataceae bacterium AB001_6]|nr:TrkA family potassium uptake protein [Anaplasmataceae bacterium AB001_6]